MTTPTGPSRRPPVDGARARGLVTVMRPCPVCDRPVRFLLPRLSRGSTPAEIDAAHLLGAGMHWHVLSHRRGPVR